MILSHSVRSIFRKKGIAYALKQIDEDFEKLERQIEQGSQAEDIDLYQSASESNLAVIQSLEPSKSYRCKFHTNTNQFVECVYFNGHILCPSPEALVVYDISFNTGEVSLAQSIPMEFISLEVKLDVASNGSVEAARNLELLNKAYAQIGDHFTINIDAGIGVGKFIPGVGGEGHITTATGVNVHYLFGIDGTVMKDKEIDVASFESRIKALEDK